MSIIMYDSINQQSAVNKRGRERKVGRGPWRFCLGLRMEVKLSSRTMGFCVPLCYLYLSSSQLFQLPLALHIKCFIPKRKSVLCSFTVLWSLFSKVDNRCLARKPSILIVCSLQLLSTSSLHFEFNSTSFSLLLLPPLSPHSSYHIIHFFLSSFCLPTPLSPTALTPCLLIL